LGIFHFSCRADNIRGISGIDGFHYRSALEKKKIEE